MKYDADLVILGGGLAGACLASLVAARRVLPPGRITLLEARLPLQPQPGEDIDLRVSAISRATQRILAACGVWEDLSRGPICAYERMVVWDEAARPGSAGAIEFDCADVGQPNLGYIVENRRMQWVLLARARAAGVRIVETPVRGLSAGNDSICVEREGGSPLIAPLVVAADGADSPARRMMQIPARERDSGQRAVVCHIRSANGHAQTAWQRFLHTGPIALLPLHDGRCSIVWTTTPERASELVALTDEDFCHAVERATDGVLGHVESASTRAQFPLRSTHAESYVRPRFALVGDAAHSIHPLAGQGVNLGFLDCAVLTEVLGAACAAGQDGGDLRVLRRYERRRKGENLLMLNALNGLNDLFSNEDPFLGVLRRAGFSFVNRVGPLKTLFMRRALGLTGDLPRVALVES